MKYSLLSVLLFVSQCCFSQQTVSTVKKDNPKANDRSIAGKAKNVEQLLARWETDKAPGFSIGIIKEGKFLFSKGYGLADLEHGVRNTPSTVYNIASLSKQFTGFCVLLLEEEGR